MRSFQVTTRVGVNGFGRIGRNFFRAVLSHPSNDVEVVAVNDLTDNATLAHLLKYDTVLGKLSENVSLTDDGIRVGEHTIKVSVEKDPAAVPWGHLGCDHVIEPTGPFTSGDDARKHLEA